MARENVLVDTLVELADNLVDNFDVIDLLNLLCQRCVEALDVDAAGVMLSSPTGELQFIASSSESMRVLELFQIQADEGPCVDCATSGRPVVSESLTAPDERWPRFTPRALAQGFHSVHSLPMHLRGRTIGALNLFRVKTGVIANEGARMAQGLADVATIAILQHRSALDATTLNAQLNHALNSRIIIEQAKGMVAQTLNCDMDHAFAHLRKFARDHNQGITLVASMVVGREIAVDSLVNPATKDPTS